MKLTRSATKVVTLSLALLLAVIAALVVLASRSTL